MTKEREALKFALEALEKTRNALAWFYDSYPQDVTKKGDELLPHVETVLTAIREALAQPEPDWRALVLNHNADCDARCDMDRCGYKPYYEYNGRRCPDCPVYDKIEAAHGIKENT